MEWTKGRLKRTRERLASGWTLQRVGDRYGISRQRVEQIVRKHFPDLDRSRRGLEVLKAEKQQDKLLARMLRTGRDTREHPTEFSRRCASIFTQKKKNSKYSKWDWDLLISDIQFPTHCPVLGMKLDYSGSCTKENSPSFDRVDPKKGYVRGNVLVVSWRANRIKNDGTPEEHMRIATYYSRLK